MRSFPNFRLMLTPRNRSNYSLLTPHMESTRQHKIARLIQKDLSDIFLRYAKRIGNVLISVSEVRVSPDLSVASVYLSIFPDNRERELMDKISEDTSAIRGQLGTLERHQLRIIPELRFFADETIQRMEHIDELLKK